MRRLEKKVRAKAQRRQHHVDFWFAVRWLGLAGAKKRTVFDAAADALLVSHPATNGAGYELLHQFRLTFQHAQTPLRVNASAPTVRVRPDAPQVDVNSDAFLASYEWRKLRMVVLKKRGARCECCGATPKDGVRIHVDHIQPRRKHPELALTESNLQVLCEVCNHGKGSWDNTDWRADSQLSGKSSADSPVTRSGDGDEQIATPVLGHARKRSRTVPRLVRGCKTA